MPDAPPDTCTYCPHYDSFQRNCSHPQSQTIMQELAAESERCPVFDDVRAEAMRNLTDRLKSK